MFVTLVCIMFCMFFFSKFPSHQNDYYHLPGFRFEVSTFPAVPFKARRVETNVKAVHVRKLVGEERGHNVVILLYRYRVRD